MLVEKKSEGGRGGSLDAGVEQRGFVLLNGVV